VRLAIPPYPRELEEEVCLPDGRHAVLRPIRPEDEPALRALFTRMSPEHIRLRFFQPLHRLSHGLAARLTQIDYDRQIALVLTAPGLPGEAEILGVGRLIRDPAGVAAEYALTVRTDLGGRGYGRFLMERLIVYARRLGLKEVFGLVLSENEAMLALCRKLGFRRHPVVDDPSVVRVSLSLEAAQAPQGASER
jgi:acetyltransferase